MAEVAVGNVNGVLAEVRDLAQVLIAPGAGEIDHESRFPDEHLRALAQISALGLLVRVSRVVLAPGWGRWPMRVRRSGGVCVNGDGVPDAQRDRGDGRRWRRAVRGAAVGGHGEWRGARHVGVQRAGYRRAFLFA